MEDLAKQVDALCITYYRDCVGNRLNQFSWGAFRDVLLKMIKEHKEVKKNDNSK